MERKYKIYKISCINGHCYIGYTIQSLDERLRQHVNRALRGEAKEHPFYCDIRKLGKDAFDITALAETYSRQKAMSLEKKYIALYCGENSYNISPGGLDDASCGGKTFWKRLNENPEEKEIYLKKLSETKKKRDWSDYNDMSKKAFEWRKNNPKEAYKMNYRARRMANKTRDIKSSIDDRPLKEKLMWKYKRAEMTRKNAIILWSKRTEEEKAEIGRKISAANKERMKSIAILPDFNQKEWPYAKATVLRKIRYGMNRDEIILDAIENVKTKGSHWTAVESKLKDMEVLL